MSERRATPVVTCFLRHRGDVLLLRRSERVGTYRGRWGAVSGHVEADPDRCALREIDEETGLGDAVTLARRGEPYALDDAELGRRWLVHPYLFDCTRRDARLDWETAEAEWVSPPEILRRNVVPALWRSYLRVAPTVEQLREDRVHGSAYLSYRALEVLRDEAAERAHAGSDPAAAWRALRETARALLDARPAMTALANRIHRVMHAAHAGATPSAVERHAHAAIGRALDADAAAAGHAAALLAGKRVLTLSRSGTVTAALRQAHPAPLVAVAASYPPGEGVEAAEALAAAGLAVTLLPDFALASAVADLRIEAVLVGADAVGPDGAVVNRTGTRLAALAARDAGVPCYAVAVVDKVSLSPDLPLEESPAAELYAGGAPLRVYNPTLEATPAALFTGIVLEAGVRAPGDVARLLPELETLRHW